MWIIIASRYISLKNGNVQHKKPLTESEKNVKNRKFELNSSFAIFTNCNLNTHEQVHVHLSQSIDFVTWFSSQKLRTHVRGVQYSLTCKVSAISKYTVVILDITCFSYWINHFFANMILQTWRVNHAMVKSSKLSYTGKINSIFSYVG